MKLISVLLTLTLSVAALAEPVLPRATTQRDPNAIAQELLLANANSIDVPFGGEDLWMSVALLLHILAPTTVSTANRCYLVSEEAKFACAYRVTTDFDGVTKHTAIHYEVDAGADGMPAEISNLRAQVVVVPSGKN